MIRYELMHNGTVVQTLTTKNAGTEEGMINFMLKLADGNLGIFSLWRIENDPETGQEKYAQIACARDGVDLHYPRVHYNGPGRETHKKIAIAKNGVEL